jgi:hypothetical protein
MSLSHFLSDPFTYPGGGIAADVPVQVLQFDSVVKVPIYHDAIGTRKPNPTRTGNDGMVEFYAEPGTYDLLANGITTTVVVEPGGSPDPAATSLVLSVGSPGGVGSGRARVYNDTGRTMILTAIRVSALNVAGGGLLVDVNKNGVSIYTAQQNRPSLPAGAGSGTVKNTGFDTGMALADGDYVTVDVDQGTYDHLVVQIFVR